MLDNLCIWHARCADGFTSAWVVNKALNGKCEFHAGNYGKAPPDVTGKNVYIVDFSYPRDILIEMATKAKKIVVLDHHDTAEKDLCSAPYPADIQDKLQIIFDMKRSGAMLAWDYFFTFTDSIPPLGLQCVQDRDLWKFNIPETKAFTAYLFSEPMTFEVWDKFMNNALFETFVEIGKTLLRQHDKDVETFVELTETTLRIEDACFGDIPCCNVLPNLASDAGHYLLQKHKDAPFSATFYLAKGYWQFSLRSADDRQAVSIIAKEFGGGGHRNAAGFRISTLPGNKFYCTMDQYGVIQLNLTPAF